MYVKLPIPERLKNLRKERHLTMEELAEAAGLSKSALGNYDADDYKEELKKHAAIPCKEALCSL